MRIQIRFRLVLRLWKGHRTDFDFPQLNASSHGGYPFVHAVHAEFMPLVQFL